MSVLRKNAFIHAPAPATVRRERMRPRVSARESNAIRTRKRAARMALIKVHGECCDGAHRLPAGRTARKEEALDVLPVRQSNSSKVGYCRCPRHRPHL
ncbi:hypothetical protein BN2475_50158 [Paraburkholderia ribeironis]|uniref:Uncharacterized protein n=1 Tax=Paraburkholderia ribeironis TaxID=1247936 RepID=A0A1N7RKP9_9BURK|nr:hypothetical protein BN2475_50158 [Paraburkholderia ribeironis]